MDKKELYFIALIPHNELRDSIREIKERIRLTYGAGHALKSPAHITLQMPFKRSPDDELKMIAVLKQFAVEEICFSVELDGYGAFAPRVIYIRITDPEPVRSLHQRLKEVLLKEMGFNMEEIMNVVHPHITVATRDLTRMAFNEAWPDFRDEGFTGHFDVQSIVLLKHNGRNWDILEEFPLGKK